MPLGFGPIELLIIMGLLAIGILAAAVWCVRRLLALPSAHDGRLRPSSDLEERVRRVEERVEDVAQDVRRTEEGQRFVADVLGARGQRDRTS